MVVVFPGGRGGEAEGVAGEGSGKWKGFVVEKPVTGGGRAEIGREVAAELVGGVDDGAVVRVNAGVREEGVFFQRESCWRRVGHGVIKR